MQDSIDELKNSIDNLKTVLGDGDYGIKGLTTKMNSLSSDLTDINRNLKNLVAVLSAIERKLK